MNRVTIITIVVAVIFPVAALAQDNFSSQSVFADYLAPGHSETFLRVPGLDFSSSMGFSYSSFGSYGSQGFGYYMGHFNYSIGSDWLLNWDVGIRSMLTGPDVQESPQFFVPNFNLTYCPSRKFMISFSYRQYQYPMNPAFLRRY